MASSEAYGGLAGDELLAEGPVFEDDAEGGEALERELCGDLAQPHL